MATEFVPIEHFKETDDDASSVRIRDMPYGKHREAIMLYPSVEVPFGNVMIGRISAPEAVLLQNIGYEDLIIEEIIVVGDFVYSGLISFKLKIKETKELLISFQPMQEDRVTGGLYVKAQNAAGRQFLTLSGSGVLTEDSTMQYPLLDEGNATGDPINISSGVYGFIVTGSFDGANARLQWRADSGASWMDIPGTTFLAPNTIYGIPLNLGQAQVVIGNPGVATSITATLAW